MPDLAFNVVALDKQATSTLMRLAEQVDRLSDKLDRLNGKTITADVNIKTDQSSKGLDSLTNRWQLMGAGIIAGSPAIGAAIIGGIGAGFIGLAALALKSNDQVQASYQLLWKNVVGVTTLATAAIVPQVVGAGNAISNAVLRMGGQLKAGFSAAAPDIVALTRGVITFAQGAMPGVVSAMQNSLPVFQGVANAAGTIGGAIGSMAASVGQHAAEYGAFLTSIGNITSSVISAATTIVNDMAAVWATNASSIDGSVSGLTQIIAGLATGILPVFSAILGVVAGAIKTITDVLGPMSSVLGTVGGIALATWGAFKVVGLVTAGVVAFGERVGLAGTAMGVASIDGAKFVASLRGVEVSASLAARGLQGAGIAAGEAGVAFGAATRAIAGPLGIALIAGTALLGLFASGELGAGNSTVQLTGSLDGLTAALQKSNGEFDNSTIAALHAEKDYKTAADAVKQFGVSTSDLDAAATKGGPGLDAIRAKLLGIIDANHEMESTESGDVFRSEHLNTLGTTAKKALDNFDGLAAEIKKSQAAQADAARAADIHAGALLNTKDGSDALEGSAKVLGISVTELYGAFLNAAASSDLAGGSLQATAAAAASAALVTAKAKQTISDTFKAADRAVESAELGVADAAHAYQGAVRGVADAQHGAVQAARSMTQAQQGVADAQHGIVSAQRAVQDAIAGVTTARTAYVRAQEQERAAERSLSDARQQAVRDLKAIALQLEDQNASEASARVRLFESQQNAAGFGITGSNARSIAGQTVTATNVDQVKTAIDLLSAQNSLNNAMNSGRNLRQDAAVATAAGVEGSKGVISAQQALRSAQEQVASSALGIVKANQQVQDSNYALQQAQRNLTRAHQAVSDAAYGEQRAHQAVSDAHYQSQRSAQNLTKAKEALKDAHDAASRSFDINTAAGIRNLTQLKAMADAMVAEFGPKTQTYNEIVKATAEKFGITTQAAEDLVKKLGIVPQDFKFNMTGVAAVDAQNLWSTIPAPSGPTHITGPRAFFAAGGQVDGVGGPRDDMNLAWLSHREYVHPVDAVDFYGEPMMEAIRTKRFPRGGDGAFMPRFADGGTMPLYNGLLATLGVGYQTAAQGQRVMGYPHPAPLIPKYVPQPFYGGPATGGPAIGGDALAAQNYARTQLGRYGWGQDQMGPLISLWNGESGWLWWKVNTSSGATGIPQSLPGNKMAAAGPDWRTNPSTQINWGLGYIAGRYHTPAAAYGAWLSRHPHWYADGGLVSPNMGRIMYGTPRVLDSGGTLHPGLNLSYNGTGRDETVRTGATEDQLLATVQHIAAGQARAGTFTGNLYLESGEFLGRVRGEVRNEFRAMELASGVL